MWFVSTHRHLDFRLQPAADSASTSRVAPYCRMDYVSTLQLRSSCCWRVFHYFRLVSHTSTRNSAFRPPKRKLVTFWAVSRTYPKQLKCTNSRDRGALYYQFRGLPLADSECVCPQINGAFVLTRVSAMPSAVDLPVRISRSQELTRNHKYDNEWNSLRKYIQSFSKFPLFSQDFQEETSALLSSAGCYLSFPPDF